MLATGRGVRTQRPGQGRAEEVGVIPDRLDTRARRRQQGRRRLILLVTGLVAVALVAVLVVNALGAGEQPAKPASPAPSAHPSTAASGSGEPSPSATELGSARVWPSDLVWPSERSFKADQIQHLGYAPRVVFFGGSRSVRFDPTYLQKKTGLKGFNLAMTNGKPEDAWVFAHFLHDRSPKTMKLWIWGIQPSTLYQRDLEPGLVQDPRLSKYLPTSLLEQQAKLLPTDPSKVPTVGRVENRRYSRQGMVVYNPYDAAEAKGKTLEQSLKVYIAHTLAKMSGTPTSAPKASRSREYFEKTLGLLNSYGVTPILMDMPVQPEVLTVLRQHGYEARQQRFLDYIDSLHAKYDFRFIDVSDISSFGGDPNGFYDGVHIKAENANKVIDKLVATFPDLFRKQGGG